ncbi:MAG: 4Fe-4S dicluster domain-containing protein [Bacilli bacterium]|nr:4Fe-4S dicluster domain-containing protein [Bacilli bacterium]
MKRYITLKKDFNIKLQSSITKHLTPQYIYLPIPQNDEIHSNVLIKKEEKISNRLISPISGKIIGMKYCLTPDGSVQKCLVILNDYKETMIERRAIRKKMTKISYEQMLIELKEYHYDDLITKLQSKKAAKLLICNGMEDEPYVANEIFIGKENTNMILETIDAIKEIMNFEQAKIIIKNNDREGIESYSNFLGTYSNIELQYVPDYYLIAENEFLKEYLNINDSCLILKPSELYTIYNVLKRRHYVTQTIFTISGDAVKNPQIIEAKIGSSVKEILHEHINILTKEHLIYINGLMKGITLEIENLIVTPNLKSILIMNPPKLQEKSCINCGKCYQICPKSCNPRIYLKKHQKEDIKDCIDCGLCSYICPSQINLRKIIKGD